MVIPMLKIRRPLGRLIFNMGITIPDKTIFLIETPPCVFSIYEIFWVDYPTYSTALWDTMTGVKSEMPDKAIVLNVAPMSRLNASQIILN